jgi:hypothetical protein
VTTTPPDPLVHLWRRLRRALERPKPEPEPVRHEDGSALPPPPPWLTPEYLAALRRYGAMDALQYRRWRQAFDFYNAHHPRPLSLTSRTCYGRVHAFMDAVLASYLPPPR